MKRDARAVLVISILCAALMVLLTVVTPDGQFDNQESEDAPEQTVITLVYAYQNSQWNACIEEVIRRFEEVHPDIDVQYEIRYEDQVYEDVLNKLAARDELGDIVQLKEPYAWAESGLIAPLPEELAAQVANRCDSNGETYALCALGTTTGVIYNKALLEKYGLSLPGSYREFLALCETLQRKGVVPLGFGGKDLWHFEYWLNHFLRADVLSVEPDFLAQCSSGERDWSDPLITTMLTHLDTLFREGYVEDRWPATPDSTLAYRMAEEEVAMVFSGPWLASDALELNPELDLGWFYVPNEAGVVVAGDSLDVFWAVTDGCAQEPARYAAAVEFLEFFYSESVYEDVYMAMAGFSTLADRSRDRHATDALLLETEISHENAHLRISGYVGDENTPPGFEKKLLNLLSQMCAGEITAAEAQELATRYWDECLRQEAAYAR